MNNKCYSIVSAFDCCNIKMVIIKMRGGTCVMPENEYNRIVATERKYKMERKRNAA